MNNLIVKRSSEIFENSFLKNGILELLDMAVIVFLFLTTLQMRIIFIIKMIFMKIVITIFCLKLRNSSFMYFNKSLQKAWKEPNFELSRLHYVKDTIPTAMGLRNKSLVINIHVLEPKVSIS